MLISGVTGWGLYVELPNTVEGLVHISTIRGDYYQFVEETYRTWSVGAHEIDHYANWGQNVLTVRGRLDCRYHGAHDRLCELAEGMER